jgi:hypothetical protein
MSGVTFTVRFNDPSVKDFGSVLNNVEGIFDDLTPVWDEFLPQVRDAIAGNFAKQGNAEEQWEPLDPAYAKRKAAAGYGDQPILIRTGALYDAAVNDDAPGHITEMDATSFFWGIDTDVIPYARAHDQSGIHRSDGLVVRKFLMLSKDSVLKGIRRIIAKMVEEAQGPGWARAARAGGKL